MIQYHTVSHKFKQTVTHFAMRKTIRSGTLGQSLMGYLDLHSHVLFGIDDGAKQLDESLALVGHLAELGFDTVCATPHQKLGSFVPSETQITDAYEATCAALSETGSPVTLWRGAENFWDELFLERNRTLAQPRYTGAKAFLFEINTRLLPPHLEDSLFQIRLRGLLPVMAHPERYAPFWKAPERLEAVGRTAALVVDLGAIDGAHGSDEQKAAQRLLKAGLVHAVTSDIHSAGDVRAIAGGIRWLKQKLGEAAATRLLDENPRAIVAGELPDPVA